MSILETHPAAAPITITHELSITGTQAESLWEAYRTTFEPLAELAVLQHFYSRDEVLAELANPRIIKIVGWQADAPVGWRWSRTAWRTCRRSRRRSCARKYPEHAARNAIYVGILVMVAPGFRGRTLFARLSTELWQVPRRGGWRARVRHLRLQSRGVRRREAGPADRRQLPTFGWSRSSTARRGTWRSFRKRSLDIRPSLPRSPSASARVV